MRTERNRKLVQEWEDGQAEDTQSDPKLVFEQFFSQIQGRKLQEEEAAVLEEVFAKTGRKKVRPMILTISAFGSYADA